MEGWIARFSNASSASKSKVIHQMRLRLHQNMPVLTSVDFQNFLWQHANEPSVMDYILDWIAELVGLSIDVKQKDSWSFSLPSVVSNVCNLISVNEENEPVRRALLHFFFPLVLLGKTTVKLNDWFHVIVENPQNMNSMIKFLKNLSPDHSSCTIEVLLEMSKRVLESPGTGSETGLFLSLVSSKYPSESAAQMAKIIIKSPPSVFHERDLPHFVSHHLKSYSVVLLLDNTLKLCFTGNLVVGESLEELLLALRESGGHNANILGLVFFGIAHLSSKLESIADLLLALEILNFCIERIQKPSCSILCGYYIVYKVLNLHWNLKLRQLASNLKSKLRSITVFQESLDSVSSLEIDGGWLSFLSNFESCFNLAIFTHNMEEEGQSLFESKCALACAMINYPDNEIMNKGVMSASIMETDINRDICVSAILELLLNESRKEYDLSNLLQGLIPIVKTPFAVCKTAKLLKAFMDSKNPFLCSEAIGVLTALVQVNPTFFRYYREYLSNIICGRASLDPKIQLIISKSLKQLITILDENTELFHIIFLFFDSLKEYRSYSCLAIANLIDCLKQIAVNGDFDPRAIWMVFMKKMDSLLDIEIIEASLCNFMGCFSLVIKESERWKKQRSGHLQFLWNNVKSSNSAMVFLASLNSLSQFSWELLDTVIIGFENVKDLVIYLVERGREISVDIGSNECITFLGNCLKRDIELTYAKTGSSLKHSSAANEMKIIIKNTASKKDGIITWIRDCFSGGSDFNSIREKYFECTKYGLHTSSFAEFFLQIAYIPLLWRMFFKNTSEDNLKKSLIVPEMNANMELNANQLFSRSFEVYLGYALFAALDLKDNQFALQLLEKVFSKIDLLSDASSSISNEDNISLFAICIAQMVAGRFSSKQLQDQCAATLWNLYDRAKDQNRKYSLIVVSICLAKVADPHSSNYKRLQSDFETCAGVSDDALLASAFALGLSKISWSSTLLDLSYKKAISGEIPHLVFLSLLPSSALESGRRMDLQRIWRDWDRGKTQLLPFFRDIFLDAFDKNDDVSAIHLLSSAGVKIFEDFLNPALCDLKDDAINEKITSLQHILSNESRSKFLRISSQVAGIIFVMLEQRRVQKFSSWSLQSIPSDSLLKKFVQDAVSSQSVDWIKTILAIFQRLETFPALDLSSVFLACLEKSPSLIVPVFEFALSRISVTEESVKSEAQFIKVLSLVADKPECFPVIAENCSKFVAALESDSYHFLEAVFQEAFNATADDDMAAAIASGPLIRKLDASTFANFVFEFLSKLDGSKGNLVIDRQFIILKWIFGSPDVEEIQRLWIQEKLLIPRDLRLLFLLLKDGCISDSSSMENLKNLLIEHYCTCIESLSRESVFYLSKCLMLLKCPLPRSKSASKQHLEASIFTFADQLLDHVLPDFPAVTVDDFDSLREIGELLQLIMTNKPACRR